MMQRSFLFVSAVAVLLLGCNEAAKPVAQAQLVATQPPKVEGNSIVYSPGTPELAAIATAPVTDARAQPVSLSGRLVWNDNLTAQIHTPFAGRVTAISAQPGDLVKKGQILAMLASPDFGQAQSDARRAAADHRLAQQNVRRARELYQAGVISQKDLQSAEADYVRAQAELTRTAARLTLYGTASGAVDQQFAVTAPLSGFVVERNLSPGQEVRPDNPNPPVPLFVLSDPASLWYQLDAQDLDLAYLKRGMTINLTSPAFAGETFAGTLDQIGDAIDPVSRTMKVRGHLANPQRKLKAGMFISAQIPREGQSALQVPSNAVFLQGDKYYSFVAVSPTRFTRREVKPGAESNGQMLIFAGLARGDKVVTDGALQLQQIMQP